MIHEYILLIKMEWYDESEFPLTTLSKLTFPEVTVITSTLKIHLITFPTYSPMCICTYKSYGTWFCGYICVFALQKGRSYCVFGFITCLFQSTLLRVLENWEIFYIYTIPFNTYVYSLVWLTHNSWLSPSSLSEQGCCFQFFFTFPGILWNWPTGLPLDYQGPRIVPTMPK